MRTGHITRSSAWAEQSKNRFNIHKHLLNAVKTFEVLSCTYPWIGNMYFRLFYADLVKNEIQLAQIEPGMKIMHVGCGPFPMTSICLARSGCSVTGVDLCPESIRRAEKAVAEHKLTDRITFFTGCGSELDYSGYDAVWFSLHVNPIHKAIQKALGSLDYGAKIVFRAPRSVLKGLYKQIHLNELSCRVEYKDISQSLGKKSIALKKL